MSSSKWKAENPSSLELREVPLLQDSDISISHAPSRHNPSNGTRDDNGMHTQRRRIFNGLVSRDDEQSPLDEVDEHADKTEIRPSLFAHDIPIGQQMKAALYPRWLTINWLLIAVPIAIALHYSGSEPISTYTFSSIAIIPLAIILNYAVDEIALRVGQVIGALLNVVFG
jgi:hypothetical protein